MKKQELKERLKNINNLEKRIKALNKLEKAFKEVDKNKDFNTILQNMQDNFNDSFYVELEHLKSNLVEELKSITK